MSVMSKRILVSLPEKIYDELKKLAKTEYKSVAGIIRESVLERLHGEFSKGEMNLIEKGRSEYRQGKGVNWRSIKRG
ncbi:MAG: hypothetical protein AUJ72_01665 [Candidatus Omnitrophica bacterium CG1_02_46_14]|nr:MAG: hypothetical protein AUJ72_01665 [Candidatus Omnitrophica bacterium CG1_02_46_14]